MATDLVKVWAERASLRSTLRAVRDSVKNNPDLLARVDEALKPRRPGDICPADGTAVEPKTVDVDGKSYCALVCRDCDTLWVDES